MSTGSTNAFGISGNQVVGIYQSGNSGHGFLYNGTSYVNLDDPSAQGRTAPHGVDGNKVVGYYTDQNANAYAFLYTPDPGTSQSNPVLPTTVNSAGNFLFSNVSSGLWFDPATAYGFDYQMTTPGSLFKKIDAFPTGFTGPFTISSGGVVLGTASAGQSFTFANGGVSEFEITGINPLVDPTNTSAFPLQLDFSSSTASFSMTPLNSPSAVPEPSSLTLLGIGAVGLVGYGWRRRRQSA